MNFIQWELAPASVSAEPSRKRHGWKRWLGPLTRGPWPLLAILAVQAGLSLRLVWSNTAFTDEALYLWAGHLEIAHWLHGTPIPAFPAYFSGSPALYPPIGAMADSIGGLAAARILSLGFMLAATSLLWATAKRLYGRVTATFACGLWAAMGPTLHLSAFATYDAMSMFFLALSAWCVVRSGARRDITVWTGAGALALTLANASAYPSAILDPIVVGLVLTVGWGHPTVKVAMARGAAFASYTITVLILLFLAGGPLYGVGIDQTVLNRMPGDNSPGSVFAAAGAWTGVVLVIAVAGLLIGTIGGQGRWRLLAVLVAAGLLVPLEQARLHTTTSLDKHADMGAWFAAIAAGYAISRLVQLPRVAVLRAALFVAAAALLILPFQLGQAQARQLFATWPDAWRFIMVMKPLADNQQGRLLVETPSIPEFYLPAGTQWERWSTTSSIRLANGRSISVPVGGIGSVDTYIRFIARRYFAVIALEPSVIKADFDSQLAAYLDRDPAYRVAARMPYGHGEYTIWTLIEGHR